MEELQVPMRDLPRGYDRGIVKEKADRIAVIK
jgi:hypothetical protein